jgi:hypothetical protein
MRFSGRGCEVCEAILGAARWRGLEKCLDHSGIELACAASSDLAQGLFHWGGGPVGPVVRHRVKAVDLGHDPPGDRDLLAGESGRIAVGVQLLRAVPLRRLSQYSAADD